MVFWLNGLEPKNETRGKGTLCRKRSRKWQRDERRNTTRGLHRRHSAAWQGRNRRSNAGHPCAANPWADLITSVEALLPLNSDRDTTFDVVCRRTKCSHLEVG